MVDRRSRSEKLLKAKMRGKAALSGRQRKDLAMKAMREIAKSGGFTDWGHVRAHYELKNPEDLSLRLWAGATDITEIDMICRRIARANPTRRR